MPVRRTRRRADVAVPHVGGDVLAYDPFNSPLDTSTQIVGTPAPATRTTTAAYTNPRLAVTDLDTGAGSEILGSSLESSTWFALKCSDVNAFVIDVETGRIAAADLVSRSYGQPIAPRPKLEAPVAAAWDGDELLLWNEMQETGSAFRPASSNWRGFPAPQVVDVAAAGSSMLIAQDAQQRQVFRRYQPAQNGAVEAGYPRSTPDSSTLEAATLADPANDATAEPVFTAAATSARHLEINLCGNPCGASGSNSHAIALKNSIESRVSAGNAPLAVTVQEVCLSTQGTYLKNNLDEEGYLYSSFTVRSNNQICGSNGGSDPTRTYGNIVLWLGGCYGNNFPTSCTSSQKLLQKDGTRNGAQGINCGRGAFPSYIVCSTHFTAGDADASRIQSQDVLNLLNFYNGTVDSYVGGDFNLPWGDTSGSWDVSYDEGSCSVSSCRRNWGTAGGGSPDPGSCPTNTNSTSLHIDYIWMRSAPWNYTATAAAYTYSVTDHCLYEAFFVHV